MRNSISTIIINDYKILPAYNLKYSKFYEKKYFNSIDFIILKSFCNWKVVIKNTLYVFERRSFDR